MKSGCAAIIGLAAWYLVLPPLVGGTMDTAAPLSQWTEYGTFDARKTCEAAHAEMMTNPMLSHQFGQSRCVPTRPQPGANPPPTAPRQP